MPSMIPVNRSSFGRAGGRLRRYPGAPKTPASWPPSAGQSHNAAPPPAGSPLQSEPQNELERKAPRPSSPGPCPLPTKAFCCRIFTPALPVHPAASARDFCSGDYTITGSPVSAHIPPNRFDGRKSRRGQMAGPDKEWVRRPVCARIVCHSCLGDYIHGVDFCDNGRWVGSAGRACYA